ncbi:MAG: hypothetical protein C4583_13840 [Anaerolineaceae bacterium]|nr:MAG: hypothetical protein C4583_13840 [Anaerolineaceae bacterium]
MRLGMRYKKADGTYQSLYGDYTSLTSTYKTISSGLIFLPVNATSMEPLIQSLPSPGGSNTVDWYAVYPMPTAYRVTSRTLSTGSDSYTFTYGYSGAATNSPAISDEAAGEHPYTRAYTEFRGHSQVTETDPYNKKVITTYNQDDCTSGRSSMVRIRDANNLLVQRTESTYACTSTNSTIHLKDKDTRNPALYDTYFDPIKYRWVRTASESKDMYGGTPNGVVATLITTYDAYDAYGNLTQKTVSGTGIETTTTYTQYFPNTSQWLVGLPARTYVKDSQNVTLSLSMNLYDGANTYNTAPTQGVLTATRTLISGTNYAQTSYGHDAWGNVTSQTVWTGYGTASTSPTTGAQTTYTCYGSQESIGGKWCPKNDYHTYALWTKNAMGHISYVTYDYSLGLPLTETDPNGAMTSATYDNFGRFTSLTKPGDTSPSLNVSYVNNPFKVTLTQKIDATHTFTVVRNYDGMGRQTSTVTNGVTVASTFDAYGRVLTQTMPGETAHKTTTTYDALGRPLTVTAPDTTQTNYAYDGLTTSVTDANSHAHTTVTDILGRTLSITPPTGPAVTFTYDPLGNMLTAERGGATVTLTYDKASRKLTMDDPDMGNWSYVYNALGGVTSQTDARGCVTNITYDELNRPTGKTYSNCPSTPSVTYTYDAGTNGKGRRTSMSVTGADLTQWVYDERGRVTSENKQITNGGQFVTAFTYNLADLPATMTYPDGEVVTFSYNNNMLPASVSGTDAYAQSIAYDSAMRMIQLVRGANKVNTVFDYNDWNADGGRLLNLTSTQVSTGTPLQNSTYDYDAVGNILTITDSLLGPQTQTFTYDALDRLISSDVSGGTDGIYTESYSYDSATGNLASKNSINYTAYDSNHKHAVSSLSNGNTYGYDANGNMTSRNVGGQSFTLNYDAENRLVSVSGAATAEFDYDGDGKQIKATVNGTTTVYVGNHYEVKNSVVTKYYFAGTTRLAVRTDGTLSFLLGDHLGSSSVTTDASGAKTASALYKTFGETRYTLGSLNTDYKFTGQREEASLGIYFFVARWFDPSLGRFLSPDTIVPTSTQGTQAWDRYAFVNNNPVRYTDPTGHRVTQGEDQGDNLCYGLQDCFTLTTTTSITISRDDLIDAGNAIEKEKNAKNKAGQTASNIASWVIGPIVGVTEAIGCAGSGGVGCYILAVAEGALASAATNFVGSMFGYGAEDLGEAQDTIDDALDGSNATSFTVTQTVTTQTANVPEAPGEFTQVLDATFTISGGDGKPRAFNASAPLAGYNPFVVISSLLGF